MSETKQNEIQVLTPALPTQTPVTVNRAVGVKGSLDQTSSDYYISANLMENILPKTELSTELVINSLEIKGYEVTRVQLNSVIKEGQQNLQGEVRVSEDIVVDWRRSIVYREQRQLVGENVIETANLSLIPATRDILEGINNMGLVKVSQNAEIIEVNAVIRYKPEPVLELNKSQQLNIQAPNNVQVEMAGQTEPQATISTNLDWLAKDPNITW